MLKHVERIRCYTTNWLRRDLAVGVFVTMSLATSMFASPSSTAKSYDTSDPLLYVANVEELYSAVNDPANAGATIVLSPGIYVLTANGPDALRPNRGRLEFQLDMSLIGVEGDQSAVVIDTSDPSLSLARSFDGPPFGRTGAIRMGRGSNSIEWLTIIGNFDSASGIETDLPGTSATNIRVAHVVSGGSSRGVDIRNAGAGNAGRKIEAEILDCDFFAAVGAAGNEAIRVANFSGADGGQIYVSMSGNRAHDSLLGCIIANNKSSFAIIDVRSHGDIFEHNGVGCVIAGAINRSGPGLTNSSSTTFEAHGTKFVNNTGLPAFGGDGITAFGVEGRATNPSSNNTVQIRLWGCTFSGNQDTDFKAYGARSSPAVGIAGTNNSVTIELRGVSKKVDVVSTDSEPFEPAGTNTVTVVR